MSLHATTSRQLRVVAIGGGTGLSTLLRGLKRYTAAPPGSPLCEDLPCLIRELSAIVTVTDDGGSSGRLRGDFNGFAHLAHLEGHIETNRLLNLNFDIIAGSDFEAGVLSF